jgi:cytochrome oxidase Cu insertion factor (SCO1/SenC/PrrC family)
LRVFLAVLAAVLSLSSCRREPPRLAQVPDFSLTAVAAEGPPSRLTAESLRGAPWVADFIFASCAGPCPMLSARMAELQKSLPAAVGLVSFTVDPERDGPKTLQDYARSFGADPGRWRFATGAKAEVQRLLREGFRLAAVEDPSAPSGTRVTHSVKFVLVDSGLTIRGYYDGQDAGELAALRRDAEALLERR